MTHHVTPLGYTTWQAIGPAIILLLTATWQQKKWPFTRQHILFFLITGITIAIPNLNMAISSKHLPSSIVGILSNTSPLFVLVILWLLKDKKVNYVQAIAIALLVAGLFFLTNGIHLKQLHFNLWYLSTLISPLCFALCAIYIDKQKPADLSPAGAAAGSLIATSIILFIPTYFYHDFYPLWQHVATSSNLVILTEILLSTLGYFLLFALLNAAGALYYCFTDGVVACVSVIWGITFFHEHITLNTTLAIITIICAIFLGSNRSRQ